MRSSHPVPRCVAALALVVLTASCDSDPSQHPDGVVLSIVPDLSGKPDEVAFAAVPDLLVTDDGRVIYAAPEELAMQGTLVPDVWAQTITPAGIESVRAAIEAGAAPQNIGELLALVGGDLGDAAFYFPETFRFAAIEFGPATGLDDPDMPLVEWPATASIALADATGCTRLSELEVGEAFVTAAENSAFVDDGTVYGVVAAPDWPGAPCALPD